MKKKNFLTVLTLLCCCLLAQLTMAQDSTSVDPSLSGQYRLMLSKSKTLNGYKLVNPSRLSSFYRSVVDTIKKERKRHQQAELRIKEQTKSISTLNTEIKNNKVSLASSNSRLDEISILGISFSKSTYNTIVWTLIILLALTLTVVTVRSAKSVQEARYRSNLYDEISQEYQAYKVKSNEKEKKLARELQDERNKLEEFKSRGH